MPIEDIGQDEAYATNLKRLVDDYANHTLRRGDREQELADQLNQQFLRYVDDAHQVVMRMANDGATVSSRIASNAATVDHIVNVGASAQVTEFRGIGAQVAQEAAEAATAAVNAAMAQAAQTSAAAQGTTGVAQGGLQVGAEASTVAILAQLARNVDALNTALGVLLAREAAEGGE